MPDARPRTDAALRSRSLSDRAVVALALATVAGARLPSSMPLLVVPAVVVLALVVRRPALLMFGAALLASELSSRAWSGLAAPRLGPVAGWATLVSDPEPTNRGVRVDVRLETGRYEAIAFGSAAGQLRRRAAGEAVELEGTARIASADAQRWLHPRHIGATLHVASVGAFAPGGPVTRLANRFRRTLERGAASLSTDHRALFSGFVLGDDREQRADITDDFRGSGLSHLLAVSGQNVAFVLALASPLLRRLRITGRFATTVALLAFFALVTRFEPSVIRASAMAGLAAFAAALGREASGIRVLALAVTGLVLIDPLLVHSLGFALSVGAAAGILMAGPVVVRHLPGPRWLATGLGITAGAQVGVAPFLLPAFGGIPVASLPANLLAAPAAGPLVAWGMTAGVAAGLLQPWTGDGIPGLLHIPTVALVSWIAAVARTASQLPLGELRAAHALVLFAACGALVLGRSSPSSRPWRSIAAMAGSSVVTALAGAAVVATVAAAMYTAVHPPRTHTRPAVGAELWIGPRGSDAVLVLDGRARASPVLEGVRRTGVRRLALLALTSIKANGDGYETARSIIDRYRPAVVLVPATLADMMPGTTPARAGDSYQVGNAVVSLERVTPDEFEVVHRGSRSSHRSGTRAAIGRPLDVTDGLRRMSHGFTEDGVGRRAPNRRPNVRPTRPPCAPSERRRPAPAVASAPMFLDLGARRYELTTRALVMGILNRTTDSFYDAGSYYDFDAFLQKAEALVSAGADLLDIGGVKAAVLIDGEGPFVSEEEELERVVPAVEALAARFDVPLSVDTWRASVARASFEAGAVIGNDMSGFTDPDYLRVCAAAGASVVATHSRQRRVLGATDPDDDVSRPLVDAVRDYLTAKAAVAEGAGVAPERIMLDAGLDLGKSPEMSLELLHGTPRLVELGYPVFLATSNKDVLGWLHGTAVSERQHGTNAAHALGVALGCRILRAHDVRAAKRVCETISAILEAAE